MDNNICYVWNEIGVDMEISTCEACDLINLCDRDLSTHISIKQKDYEEFKS